VLAVDGFVHGSHIVCCNSSGKSIEGGLHLRPSPQRFIAD
jgi:hypothetical protein